MDEETEFKTTKREGTSVVWSNAYSNVVMFVGSRGGKILTVHYEESYGSPTGQRRLGRLIAKLQELQTEQEGDQ
jgi:hypothetical protein